LLRHAGGANVCWPLKSHIREKKINVMSRNALFTVALLLAALPCFAEPNVTRTTLTNGMHVIIVRNPLAPAVTVYENYRVGGNETPTGFPGMAHAQEHMMFRGCSALSGDQTAAIFAQLGGDGDADTQQNLTQYYETVPAHDLSIAHAARCNRPDLAMGTGASCD
jgi:zinc protease